MITSPDLSIVIIARNEEKNIARAIESVLNAVEPYSATEIILVDSASTDKTVEIAGWYPINIVRLPQSWFLSASAGRYIGTHYTRGTLILYLDGDMELNREWLEQAILFSLSHDDIAGVTGQVQDIFVRDGQILGTQGLVSDPNQLPVQVKHFGGVALYKRSALDQVGGFNPFFVSEEEPELCIRLRHAGHKLASLPFTAVRHYCIPQKSLSGQLRRVKMDLFLGFGQIPRYHLGTSLFWIYLKERGSYVVYLAGLLLTFVTLVLTLFSKDILYFGVWVLIVGVFLSIYLIKKRSLRKFGQSFLFHTLIAFNAVRGFLKAPRSPDEYPTNAEIVRIAYHRGGLDFANPGSGPQLAGGSACES